MFGLRYLEDVVTLELDASKCTGCGNCIEVCPHAVFEIFEKKARIVDRDACMECGACAMNCAPGALSVDSGVGCASAVITGAVRGTEPTCGCSEDADCC
ncbi:MAG: 4Fe-4S binding protein [bacterium]|nr:MAG: 4Fe-4S binding protein [bacterium]